MSKHLPRKMAVVVTETNILNNLISRCRVDAIPIFNNYFELYQTPFREAEKLVLM